MASITIAVAGLTATREYGDEAAVEVLLLFADAVGIDPALPNGERLLRVVDEIALFLVHRARNQVIEAAAAAARADADGLGMG